MTRKKYRDILPKSFFLKSFLLTWLLDLCIYISLLTEYNTKKIINCYYQRLRVIDTSTISQILHSKQKMSFRFSRQQLKNGQYSRLQKCYDYFELSSHYTSANESKVFAFSDYLIQWICKIKLWKRLLRCYRQAEELRELSDPRGIFVSYPPFFSIFLH